MKYVFYMWCLMQRYKLDVARGIWYVYHNRQQSSWFKTHLGASVYAVKPVKLMMMAPIFDFLNDAGVAYALEQLKLNREGEDAIIELGLFTSDFVATIGKPYLNGKGLDAYIVADDFSVLRSLYLRNLLPILVGNKGQAMEEAIWEQLLGFQLTPELSA